jgi:hypothetical protein
MSHRVRRAGGLDTDSKKRVDVILHAMGMLDDSPMGFAKSALRDE